MRLPLKTSRSLATLDSKEGSNEYIFSDYFGVSKEKLDEYGAFNVSLNNDLPVFLGAQRTAHWLNLS